MAEKEEEGNSITLVLEMGDEDEVEITLTRNEYDNIIWSAGRANLSIEDFINDVLKKEIEKMREEEGGDENE